MPLESVYVNQEQILLSQLGGGGSNVRLSKFINYIVSEFTGG